MSHQFDTQQIRAKDTTYPEYIATCAKFIISNHGQKKKYSWKKIHYTLYDIYNLLISDRSKWWTSKMIGEQIGKSHKYILNILKHCKEPWGMKISSIRNRSGYRIP